MWWISISFLVHLIARRLRVLCCDSHASNPVLDPLESRAFWIEVLECLRKPQSLLISPIILKIWWSLGRDLLGICSRGRGEAIPQVSSIFVVVWLRFIVWIQVFGGFLGATGQTGRQDRSDRSASSWTAVTGQTGPGRSVLQFFEFASDLLRGFARSFVAFCVGLAFQ